MSDKKSELIEIVKDKNILSETIFAEVNLCEVKKNVTNLSEVVIKDKNILIG